MDIVSDTFFSIFPLHFNCTNGNFFAFFLFQQRSQMRKKDIQSSWRKSKPYQGSREFLFLKNQKKEKKQLSFIAKMLFIKLENRTHREKKSMTRTLIELDLNPADSSSSSFSFFLSLFNKIIQIL